MLGYINITISGIFTPHIWLQSSMKPEGRPMGALCPPAHPVYQLNGNLRGTSLHQCHQSSLCPSRIGLTVTKTRHGHKQEESHPRPLGPPCRGHTWGGRRGPRKSISRDVPKVTAKGLSWGVTEASTGKDEALGQPRLQERNSLTQTCAPGECNTQ